MVSRRGLVGSAMAALAALPGGAGAQGAWPNERAIEVIVPVPPGGGLDALARLLMPHVCARLSPQARFVVINRPGAGTQIGNEAIFNAAPDGYTLGCITCPALPALPIERAVRYRTLDFTWIANVVDDANAFFVVANSPLRSLADLVAAARARPGAISYGSTGIGGDDHIAMLSFEGLSGIPPMVHVPFTGSAPATQALLGGHIELLVGNISDGIGLQREGRVRALGVAAAERYAPLPEIATFREQGFDLLVGASRGFVGPPGIPPPIRARMEEAFTGALADPGFRAEAERATMPLRPLIGTQYRDMIARMDEGLKALWGRRPWRE
ncbi:MAG TPA: tripartite tricarboxylate transporter substrate binding protein [Acetobacteraceae bacterium]|nr:tripartite tricarboxylate transporter substrate binding protein [Acetobacteraceae bacterium]